jgi:hypothetical protein
LVISRGPETRETREFRLQPKQNEFLDCAADICIYGGAAGGGKSYALLAEPIARGLHEYPGFGAVIFRRDSKQITNTGGLWDEAGEIYPWFGGTPYVGMLEYRFEAGSKISFRHIEHEDDKHKYQGSQICYLGFDELPHFSQSQFWYLVSRNRSTCGVRPYVRATCNPEPGWVKALLAPWVDKEFPGERAASGELRWFVRIGGEIRWVSEGTPDAKSLAFIRATIYDNQILLTKNPEYLSTLKALPPVEQGRLLHGDWDVRREGLVYGGFESCIVESGPDREPECGGMDFGINNPFCALWGFLDGDDVLWVTGCRYQRQTTIPIHAEAIPKGVEYWCDPSGAEQIRQMRDLGHQVRSCVHVPTRGASGEVKKPLLSGIDMVSERIRTGRLKIVRSACLPLVRELGMYHYDPTKQSDEPVKEDDHSPDAMRYMIVGLDRTKPGGRKVHIETDAEREAREAAEEADKSAAIAANWNDDDFYDRFE